MPWCGTSHGVDAIIKTFDDVGRFWNVDSFTPEDIFGEGDKVAVFERFTLYLDQNAQEGDIAICHPLQAEGREGEVHAVHGRQVLHCLQFSVGTKVEVPERSQWD
jgi:hypothetical protein